MTKVLSTASFAQQRFESEAAPARFIACTLETSMLFLTTEVEDQHRKSDERKNSEEIIGVFNPDDLMLLGHLV